MNHLGIINEKIKAKYQVEQKGSFFNLTVPAKGFLLRRNVDKTIKIKIHTYGFLSTAISFSRWLLVE